MNLNTIIANNLKNLRQERNLSFGQLSELSGVSKVMLSQIEKGESNPTINTIWKIANGLKVPYTALIDEPKSETVIVTKEATAKQISNDQKYRMACYYTSSPKRNFELFTIELDPYSHYHSIGHSEKSQEYILIIEGELTIQTGEKTHLLQAGDCICFSSSLPHIYSNNQQTLLKAVVLNYYPI